MRRILLSIILLITIARHGMAQHKADTAALIREFDEVMAFSIQPYVHYTMVNTVHSGPMLPAADQGKIMHGDFYKNQDDLYFGSERDEIYLQDSLMIRVDHEHKTVQINKVDIATKKNMDLLPLKKKDRQKLFRGRYTMSQLPDQGDTATIVIQSQSGPTEQAVNSEILLQYSRQSHLPFLMQITLRVRERRSPQVEVALRTNGFDVQRMVEGQNGVQSLVMTKTVAARFGTIDTTKEKAAQMPSWKDKLGYDPATGTYSGKNDCIGYKIIKTF